MEPPKAIVQVRLTPKSKASRFEWDSQQRILFVSVTDPPIDNRANEALIQAISKQIRVAPGKMVLERGRKSRVKTISIEGIDQVSLENLLARLTSKELE